MMMISFSSRYIILLLQNHGSHLSVLLFAITMVVSFIWDHSMVTSHETYQLTFYSVCSPSVARFPFSCRLPTLNCTHTAAYCISTCVPEKMEENSVQYKPLCLTVNTFLHVIFSEWHNFKETLNDIKDVFWLTALQVFKCLSQCIFCAVMTRILNSDLSLQVHGIGGCKFWTHYLCVFTELTVPNKQNPKCKQPQV